MFKRKFDEKNRKRSNYNKLQKHVKPYESSDDDDDDDKNKQKAITYLKSLQEKYPTASFDFIIDKIDFKIDNLSKNKHNKQFVSVLHDVISEIYMEMENETKFDFLQFITNFENKCKEEEQYVLDEDNNISVNELPNQFPNQNPPPSSPKVLPRPSRWA